MPQVDTRPQFLVPDGGVLFRGTFTTTAVIPTLLHDNAKIRREKATLYCRSSQNGTWIIYDVDEDNNIYSIQSIPIVAGTLSIYSHNHVFYRLYCTFTPGAAPGTETLMIRSYGAGYGARGA